MNTAQSLSGEPLIVMTRAEYEALLEDANDRAKIAEAKANDEGSPTMSAELLGLMLDGEIHPLAAWRTVAKMTQSDLSARSGIRSSTISDIETRKIDPRLSTIKALADALGIDVTDIV